MRSSWALLGFFLLVFLPYTFIDTMGYMGYLMGVTLGSFYTFMLQLCLGQKVIPPNRKDK